MVRVGRTSSDFSILLAEIRKGKSIREAEKLAGF